MLASGGGEVLRDTSETESGNEDIICQTVAWHATTTVLQWKIELTLETG